MSLLDRVDVVLVEPAEGGNLGSSARALANMGIKSLRLVKPARFDWREAKKMAVHAADLLAAAEIHPSIELAVARDSWVVGCTARERDNPERKSPLDPEVLVDRLRALPESARAAIVFGSERTGLTNAQLGLCQDILRIPTAPDYPVLNLAQAVLLVAWEIRRAERLGFQPPAPAREVVTAKDIDQLVSHIERTVTNLNFLDPQNPRIVLDELRRIFSHAELESRALGMLRGIFHRMDVFIAAHGGPPTPNQPRGPGRKRRKTF